jgi:hypothetical protein
MPDWVTPGLRGLIDGQPRARGYEERVEQPRILDELKSAPLAMTFSVSPVKVYSIAAISWCTSRSAASALLTDARLPRLSRIDGSSLRERLLGRLLVGGTRELSLGFEPADGIVYIANEVLGILPAPDRRSVAD